MICCALSKPETTLGMALSAPIWHHAIWFPARLTSRLASCAFGARFIRYIWFISGVFALFNFLSCPYIVLWPKILASRLVASLLLHVLLFKTRQQQKRCIRCLLVSCVQSMLLLAWERKQTRWIYHFKLIEESTLKWKISSFYVDIVKAGYCIIKNRNQLKFFSPQ